MIESYLQCSAIFFGMDKLRDDFTIENKKKK